MWFFIVHHMECLEESKLVCCTYWVNGRARQKYICLRVVDSKMCRALSLCLFQMSQFRDKCFSVYSVCSVCTVFLLSNPTQSKLILLDWNPVQWMYQYCLLPLLLNWNKLRHDCSLGSKLSFTLNLVDIGIHILHTVPYTYPMVLIKRICLTIKVFVIWWSLSLF